MLAVRADIADLLYVSSEYAEAEVELRRIAFVQSRELGREHRDTLISRCKVAAMILMQGEAAAARDQLLDLVPRIEGLGGADEASLFARANLACAHRSLGDTKAAVRELREILTLCENREYDEIETSARMMLRDLIGEY